MVIITAPIKGFLPKIKGGNCHIPISQKVFLPCSGINSITKTFHLVVFLELLNSGEEVFECFCLLMAPGPMCAAAAGDEQVFSASTTAADDDDETDGETCVENCQLYLKT